LKEGKENLYEDERLFINMIHRLNEQVLDTAESEGVPERKERRSAMATNSASNTQRTSPTSTESKATSSLRSLVEENDKKILAAQVSEGMAGVDGDDCGKRKAVSLSSECDKRQKVNDEKTR
jgi:hypothetical protein